MSKIKPNNILDIFNISDKNVTRASNIKGIEDSKLHNQYSINGTPSLKDRPAPSKIDLDGKKPDYAYLDNLPPGARA